MENLSYNVENTFAIIKVLGKSHSKINVFLA